MQIDQWYDNNRGINDGESLPQEYLKAIFDAILQCQIQMRDPVFEAWDDHFLWSEVLQEGAEQLRQATAHGAVPLSFRTQDPALLGIVDGEVFEVLWRPVVAACALIVQSYGHVVVPHGLLSRAPAPGAGIC